jgi:hypothetical protein
MSSGTCLTSKLYDTIIKMPSKSHETIPLMQWQLLHMSDILLLFNTILQGGWVKSGQI